MIGTKALQQKAHDPAHVAWGIRMKRSVSDLITLFSFVSYATIPDHELPSHAILSDQMIKRFEELNEHYDGTMNPIYFLSFSTDVSPNKVFTYKEAITQEDAHLFIEAMQKEVANHELRNHWTIVHRSTVPRIAKPTQAIWSFKCKQLQMVHSSSIKLDCVLMAECNNGAQTTGKHTHQ